jgi:large subunit ribosomal protein L14
MVQAGTSLLIVDKSGVVIGECIKVLGSGKRGIAFFGDVVLISVKKVNLIRLSTLKENQRKRFLKGTLHRALIVRTKSFIRRFHSVFIRFNENSGVIVNKKVVPVSNRVYGPILRELCLKYPSLGCISRFII